MSQVGKRTYALWHKVQWAVEKILRKKYGYDEET